jgi:hypothetical protein
MGKQLALEAISGKSTACVPVALFGWGFDYYWRAAGIEPWRLACGGAETWHRAHLGLWERHQPDIIWYEGAGSGPAEPELVEETAGSWFVRDSNTGVEFELIKNSLTLRSRMTGRKSCDSVGRIATKADAQHLVPGFCGWGDGYLNGLRRLIDELGTRALVMPHHSPAYICACYAFGFERAMELMLCEPELFLYVCDRYAAGDALRMQEWAQTGAQVVFIADGWASCDVISPAMFTRFALPYQKSITEAAHAAGLKIVLWNEGDIAPILAQEASVPVDAFAFEQPRKGFEMSVEMVRKTFGTNRCLFGNLDSEELLKSNDHAKITAAVQQQIRMSGAGAPFVMSTGSPVPSDVAPEAVDAMISAARELRG